jgi:iron(III) transport system substrate-binding protein
LSQQAQRYFAEVNHEIPVVKGVEPPEGMPTADQLTVPGLDVRQLKDLDSTRGLLTKLGIVM